MCKVLLLAINAKYVHSSLSVWALAGGVAKYARLRHEVEIVEATIRQPCVDIAERVASLNPDVVGISTYIWNAGKVHKLLKVLRETLPGLVIVLGGPEVSYNAECWIEKGADYVLKGEGERSFPALLDAIGNGTPSDHLSAKAPVSAEPYNNEASTDDHIDPYSDAYFAALGGRIAYIETSRGCPFKCAFCLSGGTGVRFFPMEPVKEQIIKLSNSGTRTIKFVDRTFNCETGRAYELFEYIIGLDTDCRFHFEVAADLFDERTLELLASAPPGRLQLEAGLQSFYKPALIATSRQMDIEKAESNLRKLLRGQNIHIHIDLIAGLPHETLADFKNSFDRAYAIKAHTLQLGFLKLLYGSDLRVNAETLKIKYDAAPPYEVKSSPWLSEGDFRTIKQAENALQHTYNKLRFLSSLEYVIAATGERPFSLFQKLGAAVLNNGMQLREYGERIFGFFSGLPNVDEKELREHMVCDWFGMAKGENMPLVLKSSDKRRRLVIATAENQLRRTIRREEAEVLPSGRGVFVDSEDRDKVTGLYKLHFFSFP